MPGGESSGALFASVICALAVRGDNPGVRREMPL